ncbi:MAG: hypothetical protein A4E35_00063 [Methanoregula sp. PtaU1.Bin051]|nr:MAG: hypothetical protein A4E35_00063 [Methanoregula sp. PtaU1.Bin051]
MRTAVLPVLILCAAIVSAGCFMLDERKVPPAVTTVQVAPEQTVDTGMSTIDPSDMALQLTDLPAGYIIRERADIAFLDISPFSQEQGWKKGYLASFYRMNAEKYDITAISQRIGIYNVANEHLLDRTMGPVFESAEADLLETANASVSITELPFPKTGERTAAYRIIDANDQYGVVKYVVIFTSRDVIESIEMRGTTTDYEILKDIAAKAEGKIR